MKPMSGEVVLLFFILVLNEVSSKTTHRVSNILERLNSEYPKYENALVVVVDKNTAKDDLDLNDRDVTSENRVTDDTDLYEQAKEEAKFILYNYLSRSGPEPENTEDVKEEKKKNALRTALRSKCSKLAKCERKCEKKKKSNCPMNCQKVFDAQDLCNPPEKKKCPEEDNCGSRGRTMPPKWRL